MKRLVLFLALAACAPRGYLDKPGLSVEQLNRDRLECRYQASVATAPILDAFDKTWEENRLNDQCLTMRGYRWVPYPEVKTGG